MHLHNKYLLMCYMQDIIHASGPRSSSTCMGHDHQSLLVFFSHIYQIAPVFLFIFLALCYERKAWTEAAVHAADSRSSGLDGICEKCFNH